MIGVPAGAQKGVWVLPPGVTPTNLQEGGSMPLPPGVIPDFEIETIAHLSFSPTTVGVGQTVLINVWVTPALHDARYFKGYKIILTDPDGETHIIERDSYRADATAWCTFKPDKVGVWKIKFEFPGGYFPPGNYTTMPGAWWGARITSFPYSVYYKPSSDGPYDLIVQEEPVPEWPSAPLPKDYWNRPVSPENREWWPILGYYPATGIVGKDDGYWPPNTNKYANGYGFIPYVQAPETPHIVWRRQGALGGIKGGALGEYSWNEDPGTPQIIFAGRCYSVFQKPGGDYVLQCYDLRTGEVIWEIPVEVAGKGFFGPTLAAPSMVTYRYGLSEVPGAQPRIGQEVFLTFVGNGKLINYDPYTGAVEETISIAPLDTGYLYAIYDTPYFLSVQRLGIGPNPEYRLINWTITPEVGPFLQVTWKMNVVSNISWPFPSINVGGGGLFPTASTVDFETGIAAYIEDLYSIENPHPSTGVRQGARIMAADLKTGKVLWNITLDLPVTTWPSEQVADHGKLAVRMGDGHFYCFDLRTGELLWKSEISSWPWGVFGAYNIASYEGMIIVGQYDGVAAYDWDTGKLVWLFRAKAEYPAETPYQGYYPFFTGNMIIADRKLYIVNAEHTPT